MTVFRSTAAALLLTTAMTPAWADVSAERVWEQFSATLAADSAAELSHSAPVRNGDKLLINDLIINAETPIEDTDGSDVLEQKIVYGDIELTENADGSVSFEFLDKIDVEIGPKSKGKIQFQVAFDGQETTITEDGDALVYDMKVDSLSGTLIAMPEATKIKTQLPAQWVTIEDMRGTYAVTDLDKAWDIVSSLNTGRVIIEGVMESTSNSAPEGVDFKIEMASTASEGTITMPKEMDSSKPESLLTSGMKMDVSMAATGLTGNMVVKEDGGMSSAKGSADNVLANIDFDVTKGFDFDLAENGIAFTMTSSDMPFPVDFKAETLGYALAMPMAKTESGDAKFGIDLVGLAVNEQIWGMLDPTGQLPHDPITLRLGLSGKLKVLANLMDVEAMEKEFDDKPPFEPLSAKIETLEVNAVGLEIDGEGEVEFDQNDTTSFDGMPAPIGDVTIRANGSNTLIDRLIAMGLIPEDEAMMTRMMVGMFAESTGDDSISSHIEFKPGGGIFANGQQIR